MRLVAGRLAPEAGAGCRLWRMAAAQDLLEGWHDGYMRLDDPVMHTRRIALDKPRRRIVIVDTLQMVGEHDIELFFHCAEGSRIDADGSGYALSSGSRTIRLTLPRGTRRRKRRAANSFICAEPIGLCPCDLVSPWHHGVAYIVP